MKLIEKDYEVLGTTVWMKVVVQAESVKAAHLKAGRVMQEAFAWAKAFEQKYSRFIDGNFLANLNERVGEWVEVDEELYGLLKFAGEVKAKTRGAFDLGVKRILESWGYDKNYSFVEKRVGGDDFGQIELTEDGDKRQVKISGQIELGGIGKGYAVDKMAEKLKDFSGYFVNAGGDILAKGCDEQGKKWRIYFEHPGDPEQVIGFVDAGDLALACTSPSKRKWVVHSERHDGRFPQSASCLSSTLAVKNKHHLVDPKTGEPADKMAAVYTQAENCLLADSYATALFVMGYAKARKLLEDGRPVEAMLIDVSGEIFRTKGFQGELFMA